MDNKKNTENELNENEAINQAESSSGLDSVMPDLSSTIWTTYVPRFTEASDNYHAMEDAKLRAKLGGESATIENVTEANPDEVKLDATAEFEADVNGEEAKIPENKAIDETDESLNVYKFAPDAEEGSEAEESAEQEMTEEDELLAIRRLLAIDPIPESKPSPVVEAEPEEEELEEESGEEELQKSSIPDPDVSEMGVFDNVGKKKVEQVDEPSGVISDSEYQYYADTQDNEFTNPTQRDSYKDRFLDSIISIRIRYVASIIFAIALLVLEILSSAKVISFSLFTPTASTASLALVDLFASACVLIMALPEIVRAFKYLGKKIIAPELLSVVAFLLLGLYTLTVALTGAEKYALFGFMFAVITIPVINASLYRTKADFIAFKMVSQNGEKQIIDKKNTRELQAENMALDGYVDEYKSKIARVFKTNFVADFFANASDPSSIPINTAIIFGVPLALGFISGLVAFFVNSSILSGISVMTLVFMLGSPAFAILSGKISFFHAQRAALSCESTAIGESAHHDFSSVDVFAFEDTDMFGPDDVNLKSFMFYGERDSMEKVMRQMCALFAAVGGPLDYMFSNAIDNRVRHKTATNVIVEDDGLCGDVMGHRISAGSEDYMRRNNIAIPVPSAAGDSTIDTTKVMYAAEDGEVLAKFYIRYSFSEEFTMLLPELRKARIIPLVYTRDPNVSNDLIYALTAGVDNMRVVRLYNQPPAEEKVYPRVRSTMLTYGDKLDAASMVVLSKKYRSFTAISKFIELCAMIIGVTLAIVFSFISMRAATVLIASVWQVVWCQFIRLLSKSNFIDKEDV